jgi:hypothetical protein
MIKALMLVATIAVTSVAQAKDIASVDNNDGGKIVFTATSCPDGKSYVAYGFGNSSNDTILGCHFYDQGAFWVRWSHKQGMSRYPGEAVTWDREFLEFIQKKKQQTY